VEPERRHGVQAVKTDHKEVCMRGWTLVVSIAVHLLVIAGVIVAPLFATDELPEPPRAAVYLLISARMPDLPVLQRSAEQLVRTPADFPVTAPDTVGAEPAAPQRPADPIDFGIGGTNDGGTSGFLPGNAAGIVAGTDLILPAPEPAPAQPVRVGGAIRPPQKIRDVAPRYPSMAQASRVEGVVILEATIGEDGGVRDVRVLRGKPLLDVAAAEAVRQWRFTPTLLNGQAVPVVMTVTVSFTLN
jgi:periplasmic protein TonB